MDTEKRPNLALLASMAGLSNHSEDPISLANHMTFPEGSDIFYSIRMGRRPSIQVLVLKGDSLGKAGLYTIFEEEILEAGRAGEKIDLSRREPDYTGDRLVDYLKGPRI